MFIDKFNPNPVKQLQYLNNLISNNTNFTFIRFSDGEIEILKNRYLEIGDGITYFRGQTLTNNYPVYDRKKFDPELHSDFRNLLIESAKLRDENYFIGIPTRHNNAIEDRDFMIGLNGGFSNNLTFADLLINSNYKYFRKKVLPNIFKKNNLFIIANFRANFSNHLKNATHIKIQDNIFNNFEEEYNKILNKLLTVPKDSIILSSASSFTNIIGYSLYLQRKDLTFIDVGTSINDILMLESRSRLYHQVLFSKTIKQKILAILYKFSDEYKIKW